MCAQDRDHDMHVFVQFVESLVLCERAFTVDLEVGFLLFCLTYMNYHCIVFWNACRSTLKVNILFFYHYNFKGCLRVQYMSTSYKYIYHLRC